MINIIRVRMYVFLLVAGFLCLGLTAVAQSSAADRGYPDGVKGDGDTMQQCDGPTSHHWSERGVPGAGHHGRHLWHALRQLDLSVAQKAAIHEISIALRKDEIKKRAELEIAAMEFREYLRKDSVEMSVVESQVKKIEGFKTAMKLNAIKAREEIKSKLTPDQRKKFVELMRDAHQGHLHGQPAG
jgi:Spy/CpxP family protein refolding chaperone